MNIYKKISSKGNLIYSLYFKTTLLCFLSYLITNIPRFSSTVHREIPFILFSHHPWTKEGNLFQLFIILYLFIVNPLGYFIYHYCLNKSFKIKQPLRFYFNATLLSFIDLLLTLIKPFYLLFLDTTYPID